MILTKLQLIKMILPCCDHESSACRKAIRTMMKIQDHIFIKMIASEYNLKLDPVRKNTYIIK